MWRGLLTCCPSTVVPSSFCGANLRIRNKIEDFNVEFGYAEGKGLRSRGNYVSLVLYNYKESKYDPPAIMFHTYVPRQFSLTLSMPPQLNQK